MLSRRIMDTKVSIDVLRNMHGMDMAMLLAPASKGELKTALDGLLMSITDDQGTAFNSSIG